ncbi:MAG: dihydrolipoamide acetyltransferase family protein [Pseudomonadota bacterium]
MSEYTFKLPDLGEGTVESEIAEWFIKVGDIVNEEDVVGTMMTDKAAVELSSPVTGKVLRLAGEPGDIVAVGAPLVVFETDGVAVEETVEETATESVEEPVAVPAAPLAVDAPAPAALDNTLAMPSSRVITSPANRRRAKEMGVDLARIPGTGAGGRITRKDFDQYLKRQAFAAGAPATEPAPTETREIKVIGLRRIIAERMSEAKREIPHFSYVEEIDITELDALRRHLNSQRDAADRLTILPLLGMALIRALRDFPQCNATYDKARNVILQHGAVHLGVASQTSDGLKVPVVHNAQAMDLDTLAGSIRQVTDAAKNNTASKEQLSGSTITITSLGKLGGIASTPVINRPEVGIIGVNRAVERPMVVNGEITIRLMMNLSTSFDHRFVDGYDAAAMVQAIKQMLEHPATIFI